MTIRPVATTVLILLAGVGAPLMGPFVGVCLADTNRTPIAVPLLGTQGPASPYPSTITIVGRGGPAQTGQVSVALHRVTHPCPDNLSVLLVHNNVDQYLLMSGAGGCRPLQGTTIVFDAAAAAMPNAPPANPPFGQSVEIGPSIYGAAPVFPAPAPQGAPNLGLPPATTNVNGTWSLYVIDNGNVGGPTRGAIAAGWSLNYVTDAVAAADQSFIGLPNGVVTFGVAEYYPITFDLTGVPADATVRRVNCEIRLAHTYPDDLRMVLQSPAGTSVVLMANAGGSTDVPAYTAITFASVAPATVPDAGPLVAGTYRPGGAYTASIALPAPAPQPPYETEFSALVDQPATGTWRLWVYDDKVADIGTIATATLTIETQPVQSGDLVTPAVDSASNQPFVHVAVDIFGMSVSDSGDWRVTNAGVFYAAGALGAGPSPTPHPSTPGGLSTRFEGDLPLRKGTNDVHVRFRGIEGNELFATLHVTVDEFAYSLAEGATGGFFDLDVTLANAANVPAPVDVEFLPEGGGAVPLVSSVAANTPLQLQVDGIVPNAAVSTVVHSTDAVPLAIERTMIWDARGYGGHGGTAVAPATRWLFAEGAQGYFSTYVLLANDGVGSADVTIDFLLEGGGVVTHAVSVPAKTRRTISAGDIPALVGTSFGIDVSSTVPIIAERAMYLPGARLFEGGHESAGVNSTSTRWFLAEGATGPFFECYVLVSNPNPAAANVTLTYLLPDGTTINQVLIVPANSRRTVNVETVNPALANTPVSTTVVSDVGVVVERAMYWPDISVGWQEAHNSFGVTETALRWGLADGRLGGARGFETYVLLANPNPRPAEVRVRFLKAGQTFVRDYTLNATSRLNIWTSHDVPELGEGPFSVEVQVLNYQPIAVEKAMYWNAEGAVWAGGTNVTGTRLPPP